MIEPTEIAREFYIVRTNKNETYSGNMGRGVGSGTFATGRPREEKLVKIFPK